MIQAAKAGNQMQPSALRPIPMRMRPDLIVETIDYQGLRSYVIKDPVALKYHRLRPEQYRILELLDADRSLESLRDVLRAEFPMLHLTLTDVQSLVSELHKGGLLYTDRLGQGAPMLGRQNVEKRKKFWKAARSVLYLRTPGWDPESVLTAMLPWFRWLYHPVAISLTIAFMVSSWLVLGINFAAFSKDLPEFHQFFGWPNLLYMWVTLAGCKIVHEFGHGLTCKYFGAECHEMGVMLLVFSPCLYCDVTDSWMLKNKWKRIAIGGAGMYIEVVLSGIAIWIWYFSADPFTRNLALNIFFVTALTTVIFNLNPLMRFDGYYMLSDLMEIPNLRSKSDKVLQEKFGWYCLGIEPRHDPFMPQTGIFWFIVFAIASWCYKWFIMFGIAIFLYTVLKPYGLQSIGASAAVFSIGGAIGGLGYNLYKQITSPRVDPLSKPKIAATLIAFGLLAALAWAIPLPLHVYAPFVLEPADARQVYVQTPGELQELLVHPGERVAAGQVLARLSNPELEDELRALQAELKAERVRADAAAAVRQEARYSLAMARIESLEKQIREMQQQLEQLVLSAPVAGTVVAPPARPEPPTQDARQNLPTWFGTPLDNRNLGASFEEGTLLLTVAPDDRTGEYEATLLVDQADRNDVQPGQTAELKFEHLPHHTYEAKIDQFSHRDVEFAPPVLSNKYGGNLATVSEGEGRERLLSPAYQASIELNIDPYLLQPGLRGEARLSASRSAGEWVWRWVRQTFHFKL